MQKLFGLSWQTHMFSNS